MKLLALDTSSLACSVALQVDKTVLRRHEEQAREHTRILVPMLRSVLEEASVELSALDAIVLGNGPGSFIGMRIAASVAQGLAFGAGLKVVPVSSMAALATGVLAQGDADIVVVAQDAHMEQVYLGIYERDAANLAVPVCDERLHGQGPVDELREWLHKRRIAAGFGWQRYPALAASNRDLLSDTSPLQYPDAANLLALGARDFASGLAVQPEDIVPAYLRQQVAEKPPTRSS
jgi:tRNA threonylcarbamoyladenosine biosynthesis protein TsaB